MRRPAPIQWLLVVLVLDLMLQFFGLWRSVDANPTLLAPAGDALEYWQWSERIADGEMVSEKPFMSAPLYPYFVALLRLFGGGMMTLFVVQLLLRSATAWLLARCSKDLFGHWGYGLATMGLFLWLEEPAYYSVRILNSSLQLFTLALLLELCMRQRKLMMSESATPKTGLLIGIGATLGLACLANPSLLIAIPFFAWWLGVRPPALRGTAIMVATCALMIAPATWHNYLASAKWPSGGEFIPISAQAGVTFSHGNSAGATGIYKPIPGVSQNRSKQNDDAYRIALAASDEERTQGWNYTSSFFREKGTDYLFANPGDAIVLELRKLRWFFCGRNYGDLYNISLENRDPDWPRQVPIPAGLLQLSWILPAAFLGLWFLIRRDKRQAIPVATLLLAVLFVVMVFWYSPRYRLPAAPLAALLAPFGVVALASAFGKGQVKWVLAVIAIAPPLLLDSWSYLSGFDSLADSRPQYELNAGLNYLHKEEYAKAIPRLENALELGLENADIHTGIAEAQSKIGGAHDRNGQTAEAYALYAKAIDHYQRATEINPSKLDTWFSLVSTLKYVGRRDEALEMVGQALEHAAKQDNPQMTGMLQRQLADLQQGR
ncbi:MAG: tetratricopeptide repeat protein [Planctomycetes bacterium]|nr:tetratricopeptide repeat protein [Planctomycetota bacterium]MCP4860419.1 tetratricopeptide repeat protein [Planctomycetota bacterium]